MKEGHVGAAAELVVQRYGQMTSAGLDLPSREMHVDRLAALLSELREREGLVGAFHNGALTGFLGGFESSGRDRVSMFVPDWGWAAESREVLEALYTCAGAEWVVAGKRSQYWRVFSHDTATLTALSWLGFGMMGVDAIRRAEPLDPPRAAVAVRRAGPNDIERVARLEHGLREHLAAAPVFFPLGPALSEDKHLRLLSDPGTNTLIAESDAMPLAMLRIGPCSAEAPLPIRSAALASITRAFTIADARGQGVATALLAGAIEWARGRGYTHIGVDFESANVVARRFWLKHFAAVSYTVGRHVEEPGAPP
jgi:GNAT superfamily N-acetyltransferase